VTIYTCAEAGGKTQEGAPCGRRVKKGQRCPDHQDAGLEAMETQKARFLEVYADGFTAMSKACMDIGITRTTLWRWRQTDPDFDAKVGAAVAQADQIRMMAVEDSLFARILAGTASGAEVIFWMINRSDGRWKDVRRVVHSGRIFHGLMGAVAALSVHEVERIMSLPEDRQREAIAGLIGEDGSLTG